LPVVCIGNLVAGGAGKTPVVMAVAHMLKEQGRKPHILLRGYGGSVEGPVEVGRTAHRMSDVGDEALLLAGHAPTWVSKDRKAGAVAMERQGLASVIVMDDGFQNPHLKKDISLLVVGGGTGFGNGNVIPAGPLREPVRQGLDRADAVILVGEDTSGVTDIIKKHKDLPVLPARLVPDETSAEKFKDKKVIAFAGIGRPEKFRQTLESLGTQIVGWYGFPDHYIYSENEVWRMIDEAADKDALLVTTEKDYVRLSAEVQKTVEALPVTLEFEDPSAVLNILDLK